MKRLRKLEGIVEELSGQIEVETARNHSSSGNSPETTAANPGTDFHTPNSGPRHERAESMTAGSTHSQGSPPAPGDSRMATPYNFNSSSGNVAQRPDNVNKKFGRLVINDHGKTRYVSSAFWSKITDEVGAATDLMLCRVRALSADWLLSLTNCDTRPKSSRMENRATRMTRV